MSVTMTNRDFRYKLETLWVFFFFRSQLIIGLLVSKLEIKHISSSVYTCCGTQSFISTEHIQVATVMEQIYY